MPGPEPTDPKPEPTKPRPDPTKPDKIIQKCAHENTNFPGADFYNQVYASVEDCAEDCLRTKTCKSITYRASDRRCYFKTMDGGSAGPTTAAGHTSVNMKCDRSEIKMSCQREGISFTGADIRNIVSAGIEECVLFCRDTENCKAVSFLEASQRCYLKSKYGGGSGPVIYAGYTSMNMECDNSPVKNLDCLREGMNFAGADLRNIVAADEEECVLHCRDTEQCVSFAFRESDHRCYLKSRRGGVTGPVPSAGFNSMNMECDNSPVKNMGCLREGINFVGAGLRNLIVADEEECVGHCRDTEGCKGFTFIESSHQCYLKSKRGGNYPSLVAGYNSMNMECDNSPVKNLNCLREGINFASADIGNLVVADEEECVRMCRDTERCVAFTLIESSHRCYLKYKKGGYYGPTTQAGYNSMNMVCDNSPVKNLDCLREGINFPGADTRNLVVADEEECVRHCRDTELCVAFTFILH